MRAFCFGVKKMQEIKARQQQKNDIEENWDKAGENGFIPRKGEFIVYNKDGKNEFQRLKIGDGITKVHDLPFFASGSSLEVDKELEIEGKAADAKATGDAIAEINEKIEEILYKPISISSFNSNPIMRTLI